jgi:hypothetical protein
MAASTRDPLNPIQSEGVGRPLPTAVTAHLPERFFAPQRS